MPTLARLEEELRFTPRETILRVIERLEALAPDVAPSGIYPDDWVVHRVTGYRPDKSPDQLIPGAALLAGLSPLSERLCEHIAIAEREVPDALSVAALLHRWRISSQTLTRLRKLGLVARRVVGDAGRARLAFRLGTVEAFERAHARALARAGEFSKLSARERRWALRAAPRYRAWAGLSPQAAAARIGAKLGRATETIRGLLAREGLGASRSARMVPARALWRAWRWGAAPKALARAVRRSPGVVRRDISLVRRAHLVGVLPHLQTPGDRLDLGALGAQPVVRGLGAPAPATLGELLALARAHAPPIAVEERARLAGFHALRLRAARAAARLSLSQPQPRLLDEIETDLLWAARLGVELVRPQLRNIVSTLELRLERPLDSLPGPEASFILLEALVAAGAALEAIDPATGARVASAVGLSSDRVGVRRAKNMATGRPGAAPARTGMPDWSLRLFPWQRWIDAEPRLRAAIARAGLTPDDAALLCARYGFDGAPPRTIAAIAKERSLSERAAGIELRRATGAALSPLRGPAYPPPGAGRTLTP